MNRVAIPRQPASPHQAEPRTTGSILAAVLPIRIPTSALTHAGFRAWATSDEFPERGRFSFIDQEILIDMSPEELETHNRVKTEIGRVIGNVNEELDLGVFYGDRTLVSNETAEVSTEPDSCFVRWESFESGKVVRVPRKDRDGEYRELAGAPDWVLEVVSRSSVRKDTEQLRATYQRAGIREYWLIEALAEEIDFKILVRRRSGYAAAPRREGWQRSPVFGRAFRLVRNRGRLGLWKYNLEVKPA